MTQPGDARSPIRTCVGCRRQRPQDELVRCVLGADGAIRVGRGAPGRGAWLCGPGCIDAARRRKAFDRAWRSAVAPAAIDRLVADLTAHTTRTTGWGTPPPMRD